MVFIENIPQNKNNIEVIVPIKGEPSVLYFTKNKNEGSYIIVTEINFIMTETIHKTDNILCKYNNLWWGKENKTEKILFLAIGNKVHARFSIIQFPSLVIIWPLYSPKNAYDNIPTHQIIYKNKNITSPIVE